MYSALNFGGLVRSLQMICGVLSFGVSFVSSITRPWWQLVWLVFYLYMSAWTTALAWWLRVLYKPFQHIELYKDHQAAARVIELQADYKELLFKNCELKRKIKWAQDEYRHLKRSMEHAVICEHKKKATECVKISKLKVMDLESQKCKFMEQHSQNCNENCCHLPLKDTGIGLLRKQLLKFPHDKGSKADDDGSVGSKIVTDVAEIVIIDVGGKGKGIALSSSLFSATLVILVAGISWQAQDPCMPLMIALFIVVVMSLLNVVHFFLKLPHWPGLDAIVLLSFNWFILGTLVVPTFLLVTNLMREFSRC